MARTFMRRQRPSSADGGFTLVEALFAMTLFIIVAASIGGLLTSSIASHRLAREKTIAQQQAMDQIESIRRLQYDSIGTVSGNPSGIINPSKLVAVMGLKATMTTKVSYVDDPAPAAYLTYADYKKVTVTITRDRDSEVLARNVTYVAPPARATYGQPIIIAQVVDYGNLTPVGDVTVSMGGGPSGTRTDTTDPTTGTVTFPALTANPTSGPQAYYDIVVTPPSGYEALSDDISPAAAAHVQLAPGQTFNTALRIYRPATLTVVLKHSDGTDYTGNATVKLSSDRKPEQTFAITGGVGTITVLGGEKLVPGTYTASASTGTGLCADEVTQGVPDDYPSVMTSTVVLTLDACPTGTMAVTTNWGGAPADGATVTVTGGPDSINVTGTADSSGHTTFTNIPAGSATYTVTSTKGGQTASTTATVASSTTTNVTLNLPVGSLNVTVLWAGNAVSGAAVTVSGGPNSTTASGTTNGSGLATISNLPTGSGYTVTATKNGYSGSSTITVPNGTSAPVTVNLPTGTLTTTVTWAGVAASGVTVTASGGPHPATFTGTTNGSGVVSMTVPAGTTSYTVTATKGGQSASTTATVSAGSTTNVSLALPTGTVSATVTWAGTNTSGATVTLTGGPQSVNVSGTTNGSGVVTFTNVPAGSGYTVTATKSGQSASASASVTGGSTTNVSVALPTGSILATVTWGGTNVNGATVTLTGGPQSVNVSGTTNSSGQVTFTNVPAGSGYSLAATKSGQSGSNTASVTGGSTTNVTITLPTGSLTVTAVRSGVNQNAATVTVTGGPQSVSLSGTTNSSGVVTFTNVPVGSPYTVKAYKCSVSSPRSATNTSVGVASGSNAVTMTFSSGTCPP